jgi:penicillin-binding protein 1C
MAQGILRRVEKFLQRKITREEGRRLFHAAAWLALAGIVAFTAFFLYLAQDLPSPSEISNHTVSESTKIFDRTGTVLLYEVSGGKKRTAVPLPEIPKSLQEATIAIEDKDFYNEPAFNIRGILRAIVTNLSGGNLTGQGGSTITQQLARNAFLSPEKTLTRKLRELVLAVQLDRQYTKDKILEMYLNEIPYGPTIYGVETASQMYFNKPARDLTLAESALLAALPQAPSRLSPWGSHLDLLFERQRLVLKVMHDQKRITDAEYAQALGQTVVFAEQSKTGIKAPHFVLAVQDYLIQKYGEDAVRKGGLKVKTTLDWTLEEAAEKAVSEGAARNEAAYGGGNAALVAEDPTTGQILALVGSRDYFDKEHQGSYNVATQGLRQPGSALKPFVYLEGFTKGYTPDTVLFDVPTEFSTNDLCPEVPNFNKADSRCFHPQDFEGYFSGPMDVRHALAESVNIPAVKILYLVGKKDAIQLLNSFGITTLDDPERYGLSLVLGGGEVHLIDLVKAYSVLSQEGLLHDQSMILEVRDSSDTMLESFEKNETRVMDAEPIREVNDILSDVNARSGLFQSSLGLTIFPGHQVAMKTGTSNDYHDAWTVGYTPSLVIGVWAGNNDNKAMHRQGSSILAAVPIWSPVMRAALETQPAETFTPPAPIQESKQALVGMCTDANGTPHTILFCVNTDNPTGGAPSNPARDPQYHNWETGVARWLAAHPYTPPVPEGQNATSTESSSTPAGTGSGSGTVFPPVLLP